MDYDQHKSTKPFIFKQSQNSLTRIINPRNYMIKPTLVSGKRERLSNFELLRIISMLFILLVHSNYMGILSLYDEPIKSTIIRFIVESFSIVGVNCFILISGYFGIKLRKANIVNLIFQIYFFALLGLAIYVIMGGEYNRDIYIRCLFPISNYIWFIPCYIILMLFSPILNTWLNRSDTKHIIMLVSAIYIITYIWEILWKKELGFGGYSFGFFVILYCIGHILARYTKNHITNKWVYLILYIISACLLLIISLIQHKIPVFKSLLWSYNCPIVLFESICLFLFFASLKINNKVINWIAISCFAVLLVHTSPCSTYNKWLKYADSLSSPLINILLYIGIIVFYFTIAIFIDKIRLIAWNKIKITLFHKKSNYENTNVNN